MTETAAPSTAPPEDDWTAEYEAKCRAGRVRALWYLNGWAMALAAAYSIRVGPDGEITAQGKAGALKALRRHLGVTSDPVVDETFATWTGHFGPESHRVEIRLIEERS